jgi:hypothetical protein
MCLFFVRLIQVGRASGVPNDCEKRTRQNGIHAMEEDVLLLFSISKSPSGLKRDCST